MFVVSARLQRLAQATNMDVYRAFFHKNVITPDLIQQLGAGKYALGVCHEEMQQAELGRPNGQRHALAGQAVRAGVQLKVANRDHVIGQLGGAATQYSLDAGNQFFGRERLGDVIVRASFQAIDLVLLRAFGGQHDDRDMAGTFVRAQLAGQIDARGARQHPVHQNQIRQFRANEDLGLFGIEGAQHFMAGKRQIDRDQFLDRRLIFHD